MVRDVLVNRRRDAMEPFLMHAILPLRRIQNVIPSVSFQSMLLGTETIDVDDLIANLRYSDIHSALYGQRAYTEDSEKIVWLHEVLAKYSQADLRLFLSLVTGTD